MYREKESIKFFIHFPSDLYSIEVFLKTPCILYEKCILPVAVYINTLFNIFRVFQKINLSFMAYHWDLIGELQFLIWRIIAIIALPQIDLNSGIMIEILKVFHNKIFFKEKFYIFQDLHNYTFYLPSWYEILEYKMVR